MAGPIQSALGQALASVGSVASIGKKLYEKNEGQAPEEKSVEEVKETESKGKNEIVAKTLKMAQDKKIESPRKYMFDESGELLANYGEVASVMASQSLFNQLQSRARQRSALEQRKAMLAKRKIGSK